MFKILIGIVIGIVIATVGVGGLATLADNGVKSAKSSLQAQVNQPALETASKLSPELQAAIAKELAEQAAKK